MGKFSAAVLEGSHTDARDALDFVAFFAAGTRVAGEFFCSECGYGVTVQHQLPLCPMCQGTSWERRAAPRF